MAAVGAIVAAAYAARAYGEYRRQAKAAEGQLETAKAQLGATVDQEQRQLRAYVGLTKAAIAWKEPAPDHTVAKARVQNFGLTPAYNVHYQTCSYITDNLAGNRVVDVKDACRSVDGNTVVYPTAPIDPEIPVGDFSADFLQQFSSGKMRIFWFGTIFYDDVFGKPQWTDYCEIFPSATAGSIVCQNHRGGS